MREIKFRAWTGRQMFMQDSQYLASFIRRAVSAICVDTTGRASSGHESYLPNGGDIEEYLMQYTGLKDKNGVEIYEGDILRFAMKLQPKSKIVKAAVIWHAAGANYRLNFTETSFTGFADKVPFGVEVIGNIHENPELLKPGEPS